MQFPQANSFRTLLFPLCFFAFALAAMATSFSDIRVNIPQIHGDPNSDTTAVFPTNSQNEPAIVVNPINPLILVAGANDRQETPACTAGGYCGTYFNIGRQGVYTSSDGGTTWTNRGVLDDNSTWQASPFYSMSDPVIAWGPKPDGQGGFSYSNGARVYYVGLVAYKFGLSPYPNFKGLVFVSYSDDNGITWSPPVIVETRDNDNNFNDKDWMHVDNNPASPYFGRVYVTWTDFRSADQNQGEPVKVGVSKDGGATFGTSIQLSKASNPSGGGNGRQDTAVQTGPDGSAYVAWTDSNTIRISISRDGGQRWAKPIVVGTTNPIDDPIPGANFRTGDPDLKLRLGFALAADPQSGSSTLYAAWTTKASYGGQIVVSTSTDKGKHWGAPAAISTSNEGYAFFPAIDVASTGRVDVGYLALIAQNPSTLGTGNALIDSFYVQKPPAGSWSTPLRVTTVSSDPAVSSLGDRSGQFWGDYTSIASSASKVWYVYTDGRNGVGCTAVDQYQLGLASQPNPPDDCPSQFGNTDIYVSVITP